MESRRAPLVATRFQRSRVRSRKALLEGNCRTTGGGVSLLFIVRSGIAVRVTFKYPRQGELPTM